MSVLYIIGNGFDLYHQLKTRYTDFASYLEVQNQRILDDFNKYYYMDSNQELWANFEANLSNLDTELVLDELSDYLPGSFGGDFQDRDRYAFQIEIEMLVDRLTTEMKSEFKNFIVNACNANSNKINNIKFIANSNFISFNYSNTLEKIYKIAREDILYIHGSAFENDSIILGHGVDPSKFTNDLVEAVPPEDLTEEEIEMWHQEMSDKFDYEYELGVTEVNKYLAASFKSSAEIINENKSYFASLQEIDTVVILGHSMSDVDMPYFDEISKCIKKNSFWFVSYYSDAEHDELYSSVQQFAQSDNYIKLFKIDDFSSLKIA